MKTLRFCVRKFQKFCIKNISTDFVLYIEHFYVDPAGLGYPVHPRYILGVDGFLINVLKSAMRTV